MQNKVLEILGHLALFLGRDKDLFYDAEEIWADLQANGFSQAEIENALSHIEKMFLSSTGPFWSDVIPVHRIFTDEESARVSARARGYLWKLKCRGIIDHALEDEIVQKALDLEEPAGVREIKTVAALTLFGYEHRHQTISGNGVPYRPIH